MEVKSWFVGTKPVKDGKMIWSTAMKDLESNVSSSNSGRPATVLVAQLVHSQRLIDNFEGRISHEGLDLHLNLVRKDAISEGQHRHTSQSTFSASWNNV